MEKAHRALKETFGFSSFRLQQEEVIKRLLEDNQNALVLFPTGGGKSLTYQVPALCLDGLTLVISPLIALMKDQVDALVNRGVKAANLDSTLTADKAAWVKNEVLSGELKILYVAPERLNNESFIHMMSRVKISLLAVDESHCISQWGASFRPEYLKIARFAEEQGVERVLCLTATATKTVANDICTSFHIDLPGVFRTPIYRPNLSFKVEVAHTLEDKLKRLVPLLQSRTGPAIVYVTLQKHAQDVACELRKHELDATVYHAGLPSEERERVQLAFMASEKGIVCATIAFGMGIDKANIRQVIHLYMPKTLENYSQEVGRAGRDGLPSTCMMFLSTPDIPILEGFARGDTCSEKDLRLWLQEVALKEPTRDGTLDFSHTEQGRTYDMRSNVLGLCFAELELNHKCIRAVTPFYSVYDITIANNPDASRRLMHDNSVAAKTIRAFWSPKPKSKGWQIDVVLAAERSGVDREELAKQVSAWELDGVITTKASVVRARYTILNPLPKTTEGIEEFAKIMHARMTKREEEAVQKLHQVIEFAISDDCLSHSLATYFGDDDAVPNGMCGTCTFCSTGQGIHFPRRIETSADKVRLQSILTALQTRDDPRLLARMAFGITSPRLTAMKCSTSHALFGSMVDVDFDVLVKAFDEVCKAADYEVVVQVVEKGNARPKAKTAKTGTGGNTKKRPSTEKEPTDSRAKRARLFSGMQMGY